MVQDRDLYLPKTGFSGKGQLRTDNPISFIVTQYKYIYIYWAFLVWWKDKKSLIIHYQYEHAENLQTPRVNSQFLVKIPSPVLNHNYVRSIIRKLTISR